MPKRFSSHLYCLFLFFSSSLTLDDLFLNHTDLDKAARTGSVPKKHAFSVVWNMPTARCMKRYGVHLPLSQYSIIHNRKQKFLGQNMSIFYQRRLGLYPYITRDGASVNGGLPQLGDLKKHLQLAEKQIRTLLGGNFRGLAVVDWEAWRPIWGRNFGAKQVYQTLSEDLVWQNHPEWSLEKVKSVARAEFEQEARSFMSETLRLGVRLHPSGLWGYYGFPGCYNNNGQTKRTYTGQCHPGTEQRNDRLAWLWQQSTALFPSIYVHRRLAGHNNARLMVRHRVLEALRVASQHALGSQALPVLPYTRLAFTHTLQFLNQTDLENTLGECAALGTQGVVFWGSLSFARSKHQCILLREYITSVLGLYVDSLRRGVQRCSESVCHGNGRCARRDPLSDHMIPLVDPGSKPVHELRSAFRCVCFKHWSGEWCDQTL
ncbi:hyaluronidase-3 [Chanos chanos]|uniref:Hyaluronidase n=1 Tax=Chanos chanos TaxID=29144 RepID=A0A6J2W9L4_CHACN|nr:hyaluronidase-1-like [Chanos chanos]